MSKQIHRFNNSYVWAFMALLFLLFLVQLPFYNSLNAMQQSPHGCACINKQSNSWQGSSVHICDIDQSLSCSAPHSVVKIMRVLRINDTPDYIDYDCEDKKHILFRQWNNYVQGHLPSELEAKKNTLKVIVHQIK